MHVIESTQSISVAHPFSITRRFRSSPEPQQAIFSHKMSPNPITALIASSSRNQAPPRAKSYSTRLQPARWSRTSSTKISTQKKQHTLSSSHQKYRGRFRGVRNAGRRRGHRVQSRADTTISYAQRAAITCPVAPTFPQRVWGGASVKGARIRRPLFFSLLRSS